MWQTMLSAKFKLVERLDVPTLFYTVDDVTVWRRK